MAQLEQNLKKWEEYLWITGGMPEAPAKTRKKGEGCKRQDRCENSPKGGAKGNPSPKEPGKQKHLMLKVSNGSLCLRLQGFCGRGPPLAQTPAATKALTPTPAPAKDKAPALGATKTGKPIRADLFPRPDPSQGLSGRSAFGEQGSSMNSHLVGWHALHSNC